MGRNVYRVESDSSFPLVASDIVDSSGKFEIFVITHAQKLRDWWEAGAEGNPPCPGIVRRNFDQYDVIVEDEMIYNDAKLERIVDKINRAFEEDFLYSGGIE